LNAQLAVIGRMVLDAHGVGALLSVWLMPWVASDHQLYCGRLMELRAGVPVPSALILSAMERRETMSAERASSESAGLHTSQPLGGAELHHVEGTTAAAPATRPARTAVFSILVGTWGISISIL
jgi:hypothetical protein